MNAVFRKAMRDARYTILWLSIGLAVYAAYIWSLYPVMLENRETYENLLEDMPEMEAIFNTNGSFIDIGPYTDIYFALWALLILGPVIIIQVFNAITNAERDGTFDLMMSFPITRREFLTARIASTVTTILIVLTVCYLALAIGTFIVPEYDFPLDTLFVATYAMLFILMAQTMVTYMLATMIPSSRHIAGVIAYTFFFGSYLVYALLNQVDDFEPLTYLFIFKYYSFSEVAQDGIQIGNVLVLTTIAFVSGVIAYWKIENKELGV